MRIAVTLLIILFLPGCKKEKLKDQAHVLEGTWKLRTIFYAHGSRPPAREEYLTIKAKGILSLKGGEEDLHQHGRITQMEQVPLQTSTGEMYYLFKFTVAKRDVFSKSSELEQYHYLHYQSLYDAQGNVVSTLMLTRDIGPGITGDRVYEGLTGR